MIFVLLIFQQRTVSADQIASVLQTARVVAVSVRVQAVLGKAASVAPVASAPLDHAPAYCEE